ncbi:putative ribonuclease H-like domain-containing protein [Tanacetum coccineum]
MANKNTWEGGSPKPFNKKSAAKTNNFNKKVYTAKVNNVTTVGPEVVVSTAEGKRENAVKSSACWIWRPTGKGNPQYALQDQGIFDSGCSRHMTGNKSYLTDYQDIDGGFVAFAGSPKGGKITGKGKIRTGKLDFEDVYFVKELKFNLFSVSQMCDKKNSVLFTETECLVLSPDFKLLDESQVLLKVPRQNNMYSFDLKNVVPSGGLTCLFAKATIDESNLWHRRLGHINFKTMNKLVRGNLVRGLPSKLFENDHSCVACQKGKQHKASCKTKLVSSISHPLQMLHMDLFGPTTVRSIKPARHNAMLSQMDYNPLGKFDEKADEGFFVGYSINSKAFRVFNTRTRKVEDNLHIGRFLKNKPNVVGSGPDWLFDIDLLTNSMNYEPVTAGNQTNKNAFQPEASKMQVADDAGKKTNEEPTNEGETNGQEKEGGASNKENDQNDHWKTKIHATQTRRMTKITEEHAMIEAMQEELLQFKLQKIWTLVDLPKGKRAFGTKWVYRNKKDERGIVVRNKERLVAQGYTQEEGIDYEKLFAPVARIEAIRLFLAYTSFMGLIVYQMDVKSVFLYGTIKEEVYVCQPPGFEDPQFPDKVYKVEKALYGLHQAPKAWYETLSTYSLEKIDT